MKRLLLLLFIIPLIIAACSKETETIGIRGWIKEIQMDEEELLIHSILVEGEIEDDTQYDSAYVNITEETKILKDDKEVNLDVLEEGLMVEVIFDGPVAESYPVQGAAKKIIIID